MLQLQDGNGEIDFGEFKKMVGAQRDAEKKKKVCGRVNITALRTFSAIFF